MLKKHRPEVRRVLVVDDSPFVRQVLLRLIEDDPRFVVVETAGDGLEALELAAQVKPDVITLDLEMPLCNGVEFLRIQSERCPIPVVVVSATDATGELAAQVIEAGAFEFVQKPTSLADARLEQIGADLRKKLWTACQTGPVSPGPFKEPGGNLPRIAVGPYKAVMIGLSTGGPQLLYRTLPEIRGDFPLPIGVVLHMPEGFTEALARRLNEKSQVEVLEAREGLEFLPGRIIIGRSGYHFKARRQDHGQVVAQLSAETRDIYCPSVDGLFESAAMTYGAGLLAVVMTGMGSDGTDGAAWVKAQGGTVLVQSQATSVVYGMPRAVKAAGLSDGEIDSFQLSMFLNSLT